MPGEPVETKRGYCRVCMTSRGLVSAIDGDRILEVRGDRDHPIARGCTCPEGRATGRLHPHPDAIGRPMMRKDGALVPVGWDEALDDIGSKLRAIVDVRDFHAVGLDVASGLGLDSGGYAMEASPSSRWMTLVRSRQ